MLTLFPTGLCPQDFPLTHPKFTPNDLQEPYKTTNTSNNQQYSRHHCRVNQIFKRYHHYWPEMNIHIFNIWSQPSGSLDFSTTIFSWLTREHYLSYTRPCSSQSFDYCSSVWDPVFTALTDKLESIHRFATTLCTKRWSDSPTTIIWMVHLAGSYAGALSRWVHHSSMLILFSSSSS